MGNPTGRRRPGYCVALIVLFVVVTVVVTSVSARLVADVSQWWRPAGIGYLTATAVMLVLSGVLINSLPRAVGEFWHWKGPFAAGAERAVRALRRPPKWVGIVVTVVLLGTGSYFLLPAPDKLEPGRLYIMSADDLSPNDARNTIIEQWNQAYPDSPAEILFAAGGHDEQYQRMLNDAKPDGERQADLYLLDAVWLAQFVDNGYIRELDRSEVAGGTDDFVDKVLRTCERHDKLWALPLNTDVGLIYYRTDVAGVKEPVTWDDHSGAPAAALAKDVGGGVSANAIQLEGEMRTVTTLEAMWAEEGKAVEGNGALTLTPDGSRARFDDRDHEGIRKLNAATANPAITPSTPAADKLTADQAIDMFADGRVLSMRNWAVAHKQLTNRQQKLDDKNITFRTAPPPTPSVLGGQNLAISAHTDKPRAAQALVEFLTSAQSQMILSGIGGFAPTRTSVYDRVEGEQFDDVRKALQHARPRPAIPFYTEFSQVFREGVKDVARPEDKVSDDTVRKLAETYRREVN